MTHVLALQSLATDTDTTNTPSLRHSTLSIRCQSDVSMACNDL